MRALFKCLLNSDRYGISTASLGRLFQYLTNLTEKFVISESRFVLLPCVLSLVARRKTPAPCSPLSLLGKLKRGSYNICILIPVIMTWVFILTFQVTVRKLLSFNFSLSSFQQTSLVSSYKSLVLVLLNTRGQMLRCEDNII